MNTTFVTAIYSQLSDGSVGRWDRYSCSLKSLMKCEANFVVFISPDDLDRFNEFVEVESLDRNRLWTIVRPIESCIWHDKFTLLKSRYDSAGRSMDLVHSKIDWLSEIASENPFNDDYIFWIDAGLSFTGMFPNRYLTNVDHGARFHRYTDLTVFSSEWVGRLKEKCNQKLYTIALTPKNFLWAQPLPRKFYLNDYASWHIIGGLFGGHRENIPTFRYLYHSTVLLVLQEYIDNDLDRKLPVEELILNVVVANNPEIFSLETFDTWYHEDHESTFDEYKNGKPFYTLFI